MLTVLASPSKKNGERNIQIREAGEAQNDSHLVSLLNRLNPLDQILLEHLEAMKLAGQLLILVQVDLRRWIESGEALVECIDVLFRHLNDSLYVLQLELFVVERAVVGWPVALHWLEGLFFARDEEVEKCGRRSFFHSQNRHFYARKSWKIRFTRTPSPSLQLLSQLSADDSPQLNLFITFSRARLNATQFGKFFAKFAQSPVAMVTTMVGRR